jgi:PAS domain S-box-containing protein
VATPSFTRSDRFVLAGGALLSAAVFATDVQVPLGSAVGMLYVPVVLLGLWTVWRPYPVVAALAATFLLATDTVIGWGPEIPSIVYVNRPLMVLMYAITAALVAKYKTLQREALVHLDRLSDFKRALDAAAIVETTDVNGRITYANEKFIEISGYSRQELLGQDHRIVNSAFHSKDYFRTLWRTIAGGQIWHGEVRNRAKNGHFYWVDTTIVPFLDEHGQPYQYIAIRSDITARKAALEHLADLKAALDHAAIVATTDVTGRITYVNDKFVEISGYAREELLGQDHRIINSGYHPKEFIRDLWRTIANGRVWHGELRNRAKDGHFYWVDTTIVPFLDHRGKPYQYIAIRADITARKAAEEQLAQQAALARVGQMAAVVAHEVRNPLAGVKGAIQVLMSRRPAGDPELPVMRDIVARIDALSDLINDLMIFARPRPPRLGAVDLRPILADAITIVRRDPASQDVDISVDGPDIALTGDAELLRALFLNLLLNAAQAMTGHGGRITVTLAQQGDAVVVEVRDTGPGIPPDIRDQIFEPFFTTKARGGGLGLPIARRTAELHGGSLTVRCPPEGGTVMAVRLPVRPAPSSPRAVERRDHHDAESQSARM